VEAGTGGPTVLLEAGGGDSAVRWAALLPRLAGLAHVVAYDRAGLGLSDPVRPLALQTQADDLIALIRHAGEGPCVLVGHSWGGELVQLAAFEVPELVAGLVLIDPAHETFLGAMPRWYIALSWIQTRGPLVRMTLAPGRFRRRQLRRAGQAAALRFENERVRGLFTAAYVACNRSRDQIRLPMDETGMIGKSLGQITAIRAAAAVHRGFPEPSSRSLPVQATTSTTTSRTGSSRRSSACSSLPGAGSRSIARLTWLGASRAG
jgi:pimeloyl-ACP methyl ester carboxylesterase